MISLERTGKNEVSASYNNGKVISLPFDPNNSHMILDYNKMAYEFGISESEAVAQSSSQHFIDDCRMYKTFDSIIMSTWYGITMRIYNIPDRIFSYKQLVSLEVLENTPSAEDFVMQALLVDAAREIAKAGVMDKNRAMRELLLLSEWVTMSEYGNDLHLLSWKLPGMKQVVPNTGGQTLRQYIIYLNDKVKLTRQQIADELDRMANLGMINIDFKGHDAEST